MTCTHGLYTRPCTLGFVLASRIARFACQGSVEGATTTMIEQGSVAAAWVIYTMMFGYPIPTDDSAQFDKQTVCQIYLNTQCIQTALSTRSSWCGRRSRQYTNTSPKDIIPSMGDAVVQFQADVFAQVNNTNTSPHKKTMKRKAISQHRKLSADRVSKSQGWAGDTKLKFTMS